MASQDTETKGPAAPTGEPAAKEPAGKEPAAKRRGLSPRVRILAGAAVVVVVVAGFLYWLHARRFESTDDAEIDGHLHPVSAVINGTVLSLDPRVEDNRSVTAGTVLAQIDPADYQAQVAQAEAEVARLQASAEASQAQVPVIAANATGQLAAARASLAQAKDALIAARASRNAARTRVVQAEATAKRT
ncbi:MAG TPA: biotin/lipoyl-binding protein, partial [Thermoanaerobaculia bacterium]|nr:biotin/lipoyl-binding protein [Thermoanaerobaculia bacterium]